MGRSESAYAAIGIKIKLIDFVNLLSKENYIKNILYDGVIEDDNMELNTIYHFEILEKMQNIQDVDNIDEYKEKIKNLIIDNSLGDSYLLFPIHNIISTDRFGYFREGTNSSSKLYYTLNTEIPKEYSFLTNYKHELVFMITQNSY